MTGSKLWWEGDGRGEHLVDVALPHEDHEEPETVVHPGWPAVAALAGIILLALIVAGFLFISTANFWR